MFAQRKCPQCRKSDTVSAEWICSPRDRFNYFFGFTPRICNRCTLRFFVFSEWAAPGLWLIFIFLFVSVFFVTPGGYRFYHDESVTENSQVEIPPSEEEKVSAEQPPLPKESFGTVVESIILYDMIVEDPTAEMAPQAVEVPAPATGLAMAVAELPAPVEEISAPGAELPSLVAELPAPDAEKDDQAVEEKSGPVPPPQGSRIHIRPLRRQ